MQFRKQYIISISIIPVAEQNNQLFKQESWIVFKKKKSGAFESESFKGQILCPALDERKKRGHVHKYEAFSRTGCKHDGLDQVLEFWRGVLSHSYLMS